LKFLFRLVLKTEALYSNAIGVCEMNNGHTGAFFDFDRTLLETESGRLGFKFLWDRHMLPPGFLLKILMVNFFYQRHLVSDEFMAGILLKFYRQKCLEDFVKIAPLFYQHYLKPHLAPKILSKARQHKGQGHRLILISGSLRYMLEPVVADLGFDHLLCTDLEVGTDGLLTGKARGPLCINRTKRILAQQLARHENIDLTRSYAYGNHQSDIPLLELVGYPAVVEPTAPLRKVALDRRWPILEFK
jgi:HAD superfamily hydrolase (TIGR01490 family)